jgi:hypothetical protein
MLHWLDRHWGTRDAVRHVTLHEMRDPQQRRFRRLRYRFWMLDARPGILAAALGAHWPALAVAATALALADG